MCKNLVDIGKEILLHNNNKYVSRCKHADVDQNATYQCLGLKVMNENVNIAPQIKSHRPVNIS